MANSHYHGMDFGSRVLLNRRRDRGLTTGLILSNPRFRIAQTGSFPPIGLGIFVGIDAGLENCVGTGQTLLFGLLEPIDKPTLSQRG
jgi:hypothetical protein